MLGGISYGWKPAGCLLPSTVASQGFGTPDVSAAKALLDELNESALVDR